MLIRKRSCRSDLAKVNLVEDNLIRMTYSPKSRRERKKCNDAERGFIIPLRGHGRLAGLKDIAQDCISIACSLAVRFYLFLLAASLAKGRVRSCHCRLGRREGMLLRTVSAELDQLRQRAEMEEHSADLQPKGKSCRRSSERRVEA